jgi:diaminohydroxyphosphoribosylaminopyrimidine deaminase/5-amino-6-(5-phosphoribosylamino)uracil reductase
LNEAFAKWITTRSPFVTLKAALTLDGQIALPKRPGRRPRRSEERWITSEESRAEVQRMRHAADAVLTGIGTVLADDPLLTDRTGLPRRRKLWRVVVDSQLRLPLKSKLVKSAGGDVAVFTKQSVRSPRARALLNAGVFLVRILGRSRRPDLHKVMKELGSWDIQSVLIEAGATLNWAALEAGIVDKMVLFYAPKILGGGNLPMALGPSGALLAPPVLKNLTVHRFGPDFAVEGYLRDVYRNC